MNRQSFLPLGVLALCLPLVAGAAQDTWVNSGTLVNPTIDATNVINNGTISTGTSSPFDTSNTRNFTNSGTFSGAIGFRFDNAPRNSTGQLIGLRKPAANFHNRNSGVVAALDGSTIGGFAGSLLYVSATNIVNQGTLTVGAGGLMQLTGTNVNLARGGFGALSVDSDPFLLGSFNDSPANGQFYPDLAVADYYWAQTNASFRLENLISPFGIVTTPRHAVQGIFPDISVYFNANVQLSIIPDQVAAISNVLRFASVVVTNITGDVTNLVVPSNVVQQAVFVAMPGFPAAIDLSFLPSTQPTNDYESAFLTLSVPMTNVISGVVQDNTVYFQDTLAGETDRGLLTNYLTTLAGQTILRTSRPRAYILSRLNQGGGLPGNATVGPEFFYAPNFTTNIVTAQYAAYSGTLDNIVVRPPNIPAGTATNLTGRVEVRSDSLDLTRARVRGEGLVAFQTRHLVGSSNAAVDCENLSLELGSTNGFLRVKDITKASVERLRGDVRAWSGVWSNSYSLVLTNYDVSTNPVVAVPITNTVNVLYHMMVYDLTSLTNILPVAVQQFKLSATNMVMDDDANVVLEFLLKGQSFTLNGRLNFATNLPNWYTGFAPTLRYFTNNGALTLPNEAHFGDDAALNYLGFVNRGFITSFGQNINSVYTEIAGTNTITSAFNLVGTDAKVDSGNIAAGGDVLLSTATLKFNRALIQSDNRIVLTVTNALLDNGPTSSNTLICGDGLMLSAKPATGDLLGTTLRTVAPNFGLVSHYWAGADRGATTAGFSNNVALGRLVLAPNGIGTAFEFLGTGPANGLYVDVLDLSQLTDVTEQLLVDPSLTIYYAAARLSFTPSGGVSPEQYLENQFGGRLRWVSQYAGANSSVDVVINGNQTIKVNRALRDSTVIDSDSDGVPNYFDASPFDGVRITSSARSTQPAGFVLNWDAAPNTVYRVDYRTTLSSTVWTTLLMTTNTASVMVPWSVIDTNAVAGQERYYRVSYNPNGP